MARRGKRRLVSEINVVPYIDVMLVLLIIFMVTAPLLTQGVEVALPSAEAEPLPPNPDVTPLVITVDAAGNLYLSVNEDPESPVTLDAVRLRALAMRRHRPSTQVVIRGDRGAEYRHVIDVLVSLQAAGVQGVGLMTEPPEDR
ncbi:MAG: protein TolR [Gammaproteobacteria bacterium]